MKNFIKLSYFLLALPILATSCDNSDSYEPAAMPTGTQVYFSNENSESFSLSSQESSFSIEIDRIDATSSVTVPLTCSGEGLENFTIPSSVTFGANEKSADVVIGYNADAIGFDNPTEITLKIADESLTTSYGYSTITFTANIPAPWTTLGVGTFTDSFWAGATHNVTIQQNDLNPSIYRVVNPFPSSLGYTQSDNYFEFRIYKAGETFRDNVLDQDLVYYGDVAMTYYSSYDDIIYTLFPGRFSKYNSPSYWTYNTVTAYQENGLPGQVQIAPYFYMFSVGGWNYTQYSDVIVINFPGYAPKDYELDATYDGVLTKGEDQSIVSTVTLGEDVESAYLAAIPKSGISTVEDDILSGKVESVEVTESGTVNIPFSYKDAGDYYIIAMAMAEGEEVNAVATSFKYTSSTESWKQIGTGTYTYAAYFSGEDAGLPIYQSESNPLRFKIANWCYGVNFFFTMSANGLIMVDNQESGYTYSGYGMINVDEASDIISNYAGGSSSYSAANKTYTFQVVYGIPTYNNYWWSSYATAETFVLDDAAAKTVKHSLSTASSMEIPTKFMSKRFDANSQIENMELAK